LAANKKVNTDERSVFNVINTSVKYKIRGFNRLHTDCKCMAGYENCNRKTAIGFCIVRVHGVLSQN
jgi:hypothetical protein